MIKKIFNLFIYFNLGFIYFLILIYSVNLIFAQSIITQINFQNEEYVQFESNESFNLSSLIFFDDAGINKSNNLKIIQKRNNSNYLIVGENFLNKYNISKLNCSIFKTGKNELGYHNLKNSGENLTIYFNSFKNISWKKTKDLSFDKNQTLILNLSTNNFEIKNRNFCNYNDFLLLNLSNQTNKINLTNLSSNISINKNQNISNFNFSFEIIPKKLIFINNKIQFSFKTNLTNFTIEYFITDYFNNILKSKRNTSNLNLKSYTPKKINQILKINSNIYKNNILLKSINQTIYYFYISNNISKINLSQSCKFDIITEKDFFDDKLKFSFKTNQENYTISYSIFDDKNNIVKKLLNTFNSNIKSYTPKINHSQKYFIFASLISKNCHLNKSKSLVYYHKILSNYLNSTNINKNYNLSNFSNIKILNLEEIKSLKTNQIQFKLLRKDNRKRTFYLYLNKKKLSSYQLEKFSSIILKENLLFKEGKNNITIIGLNQSKQIILLVNFSESNLIKSKNFLNIKNFKLNNSHLKFQVSTDFKLKDLLCYVKIKNTKVSSIFNFNLSKDLSNIHLELNNSILQKKYNFKNYNLTLICKYKKVSNKNFASKFFYFNYSIEDKIIPFNLNFNLNQKLNESSIIIDKKLLNYFNKNDDNLEIIKKTDQIKTNFISKSEKQKESSIYYILIGVSIISIVLILHW